MLLRNTSFLRKRQFHGRSLLISLEPDLPSTPWLVSESRQSHVSHQKGPCLPGLTTRLINILLYETQPVVFSSSRTVLGW